MTTIKTPDPHIFLKQKNECFGEYATLYEITKLLNTTKYLIGHRLNKDEINYLVNQHHYKITIT